MIPPLAQKHIDQSLHNEKLLNLHLSDSDLSPYIDWAVTSAFYYAVHRMQAALLNDFNYCPDKHEDDRIERSRNRLVSAHYSAVARLYMLLYHESRKARYDPGYYQKLDPKWVASKVNESLKAFGKYPETP